jgi:type I restriction enzyme S subunit
MGKWGKIKLGNACQISKGVQLNKTELEKTGEYPCINGGIQPSGYTDKWNTEANTITISEGGNSCGFVNFLTYRFWSGGHCYSLLDLEENIDTNFLYQALKGRESLIMGLRVGSGLPNIQQKAIKEFEFDYPEGKPEQIRIAQILSKADQAIEQTENLIVKYQSIKAGLMQDLLSKGIDEHGNIRDEKIHRFKTENGLRVPEEWGTVELREILAKPLTYGIVQPGNHDPEGIYIIRSQDYSKGWNSFGTFMKVTKEIDRPYERSRVYESDLLITVVGANVGRMAIVPKELSGANISRSVARLAVNTETNVSLFYSHYLRSSIDKILFENTVGGAQPVLNLKELNEIMIVKPRKEEQAKIAERINSIETFIENQLSNLFKLQSLKRGLMQDLLSGKVKVKLKEEKLVTQQIN